MPYRERHVTSLAKSESMTLDICPEWSGQPELTDRRRRQEDSGMDETFEEHCRRRKDFWDKCRAMTEPYVIFPVYDHKRINHDEEWDHIAVPVSKIHGLLDSLQ
jgi:hypothetical protein